MGTQLSRSHTRGVPGSMAGLGFRVGPYGSTLSRWKERFELSTFGSTNPCSTNWAIFTRMKHDIRGRESPETWGCGKILTSGGRPGLQDAIASYLNRCYRGAVLTAPRANQESAEPQHRKCQRGNRRYGSWVRGRASAHSAAPGGGGLMRHRRCKARAL